jgi:hypothetical protein
MAKSSRASVVKRNNQNLKKKVFGPAETARNERLSARLLKLAQQPKSLRSEMEVERGTLQHHRMEEQNTRMAISDAIFATDAKDASVEAKEDRATEGASMSSLSISIPASLLYSNNTARSLPTPPRTPDANTANATTPILDIPAQKQLAKELLFYHLLGASTDVIGFDERGDLQLSFAGDLT